MLCKALLILLFTTALCKADDIQAIDANTFTKTIVATVKVSDVQENIRQLQAHQNAVQKERDGIIAADQAVIDDLQASVDSAREAYTVMMTPKPDVVAPAKGLNWNDTDMLRTNQ